MFYLILFLILNTALSAQSFFYSDSLGNRKGASPGIGSDQWILSIDEIGLEEERILFKDQTPYKRWIIKRYLEEGNKRVSEKYFYGDSLRSETVFNGEERILSELLYDSKGSVLTYKQYNYSEEGTLIQINSENSSGDISHYRLRYRDKGSLVSLQSDTEERIEWRSGDFDRHYLDTLYLVEGSVSSFLRYDNSRLVNKTIRNDKVLLEESVYVYSGNGTIEKEIVTEGNNNRRTERFFNKDGILLVENIYIEDELYSSLINTYSNGRLIRKQERNSFVRNVWFYEYCSDDPEDQNPCVIRQYRNGNLLKETEYLDNKTIETLYRNNDVVMINEIEKKSEGEGE